MNNLIYLFNKDINRLEVLSKDVMVYIPEEDIEKIRKEYGEDLDNNYGYLSLDKNDKITYIPYTTNIVVHKEYYYYSEVPEGIEINDPNFYVAKVDKKKFAEYELIRSTESNNFKQVYFYDNDFHVHIVERGYRFNFDTKTVEKDLDFELSNILYNANRNIAIERIKYNGFPFEIKGETYLQPFRGVEDRTYYSSLKNDVSPENREVKFFIKQDNYTRDSSKYNIVRGESISDIFLENMILKMIRYENLVKECVNEYYNEIDKAIELKQPDTVKELISKEHESVMNMIENKLKEIYG